MQTAIPITSSLTNGEMAKLWAADKLRDHAEPISVCRGNAATVSGIPGNPGSWRPWRGSENAPTQSKECDPGHLAMSAYPLK